MIDESVRRVRTAGCLHTGLSGANLMDDSLSLRAGKFASGRSVWKGQPTTCGALFSLCHRLCKGSALFVMG